jgi:hypothetical protein
MVASGIEQVFVSAMQIGSSQTLIQFQIEHLKPQPLRLGHFRLRFGELDRVSSLGIVHAKPALETALLREDADG